MSKDFDPVLTTFTVRLDQFMVSVTAYNYCQGQKVD